MNALSSLGFPKKGNLVRAKWAPLLFRPIMASPEQLVVGVAAVTQTDFHLERANQLDKLGCLYAENAEIVAFAINASLEAFRQSLAASPLQTLHEYQPFFSGDCLGEVVEAEGRSLNEIASRWMASLSSLYKPDEAALVPSNTLPDLLTAEDVRSQDRLPRLVLDYVSARRPGLDRYFNDSIRENYRRRRTNVHSVIIDFAGAKVVANFGTLFATQYASSVDRIKRRLWDLRVDRDTAKGGFLNRTHEMVVQYPARDDPQVNVKQYDRIKEALGALEEQADREEIRFRPLNTVQAIGDLILEHEAA